MAPEHEYTHEYEPHAPKLIYCSHVDFVHPHMRWTVEGEEISGVLDNMLPSAILITMQNLLQGKAFFTEDEETGMHGAEKVARWIARNYPYPKGKYNFAPDRTWNPTVCVLEVTDLNVADNVDITFENVAFIDTNRLRRMMEASDIEDIHYVIHPLGSWDEAYRFTNEPWKLPCFTLGLPVKGDFHTYKGKTTIERMEKFKRTLFAVDREFTRPTS